MHYALYKIPFGCSFRVSKLSNLSINIPGRAEAADADTPLPTAVVTVVAVVDDDSLLVSSDEAGGGGAADVCRDFDNSVSPRKNLAECVFCKTRMTK